MTVVSSFSGRELDPDRLNSTGARMLRDYLLYAESGGVDLGVRLRGSPELNSFEKDVYDQLSKAGIPLQCQVGASGYWIDFVAGHPDRPSQPILAIEADGVSYHSSISARDRDRLRQEHLERLGWKFHRIWSSNWFRHRELEVAEVLTAFKEALEEHDRNAVQGKVEDDRPPSWLLNESLVAQRARWPDVVKGRQIGSYTQRNLRQVVEWVKSDGKLYTDEELVNEVVSALRFGRKGARIVEAVRRAIQAESKSASTMGNGPDLRVV